MRSFFIFLVFLLLTVSVYAIGNPSAKFCIDQGNEYVILRDNQGNENGYCKISGNLIDGWEYYRNNQSEYSPKTMSIMRGELGQKEKIIRAANGNVLESFRNGFLNFELNNFESEEISKEMEISSRGAPSSFDWRNNNGDWMTPVKDQGRCGACWAFSSVAIVEAKTNIDLGNAYYDIDLSEQDIIMNNRGGSNCSGGYEIDAFNYIKNPGVVREERMPYISQDSGNINDNFPDKKIKISNYAKIEASTSVIKNAIVNYGPVTAYMIVCGDFDNYRGGVYSHLGDVYLDDSCWYDGGDGYEYLNVHSIAVVGYDSNGWIIKNSWGTWGEGGYANIAYSQSVYNSKISFEELKNRIFFLDESYYVNSIIDIKSLPTLSSFTTSTSNTRSDNPVNFSLTASSKSIKYLNSVNINGHEMSGNLLSGGKFYLEQSLGSFGCLGEMSCALTATVEDDAGKTITSTKTIKVDDIPPRVSDYTINNKSYYVKGNQNLLFNVNVEDADIDSVKINEISMSRSGTKNSLTKTPLQLGCLNNDECEFRIIATDKIGNVNDSEFKRLIIDDIYPQLNSVNLNRNLTRPGDLVEIEIDTTDNNYIETVNVSGISLINNSNIWSGTIPLKSKNLTIIIADVVGNTLTEKYSNYTLDSNYPNLSYNTTYQFNEINNSKWFNHSINITLNAVDDNKIKKIEWRYVNESDWEEYTNELIFNSPIPQNKIFFRATDEVENIAPLKEISIKVDTEAPKIYNISLNTFEIYPEGKVTLLVYSDDILSGIKEINALLNGTNYSNFLKEGPYYKTSLIAPKEEGEYNITVEVSDNAGNLNLKNITLNVSKAGSIFIIPSIFNGSYFTSETEITFDLFNITNGTYKINEDEKVDINDNLIKIILTNNSIITFNVTNHTKLILEENDDEEFSDEDIEYFEYKFGYIIDNIPPSLEITNLIENQEINGSYFININCSDEEIGIKSVEIYLNNKLLKTVKYENGYFFDTIKYSNDNHKIKFICYDYANNKNESEFNISINNSVEKVSVANGNAVLDSTIFKDYVELITGLNTTELNISVLSNNSINGELIYLDINASTGYLSRVYFLLPKEVISAPNNLEFFTRGIGEQNYKKKGDVVYVEERGNKYLFYLETDHFSEFIVKNKSSSLPSGSGGSGGGGSGGGSRGGSSGGASSKTITINGTKIVEENILTLSKGDTVLLTLTNLENHTIKINTITNNSLNMIIYSDPINLTLNVGDEVKLNLTSKDYYDLYLNLQNISNYKASILIKQINESMTPPVDTSEKNIDTNEPSSSEINKKRLIYILITIVIISGSIYLLKNFRITKKRIFKKRKSKKKKSKKKNKTIGYFAIKISSLKQFLKNHLSHSSS